MIVTGYPEEGKKLVINKAEAKIVREMFGLYLKGNSLLKVASILNEKGYRSRAGKQKDGKPFGGLRFGVTQIQQAIKNVVYIGKVFYAGQVYDGQQEAMVSQQEYESLVEAMNSLDVRHRAVLVLRYFNDLSYEEIAKTMGIPLGTVKSRIYVAIKTLRQQLGEQRGEAST